MTDYQDLNLGSLFPDEPRPQSPAPTFDSYHRETEECTGDWSTVEIRLVGSHPLWGHHLWNAARAFAAYLDAHPQLYQNQNVIELGAGGGLPGIVAALNGANTVVLTDYPDPALLENLEYNLSRNLTSNAGSRVFVKGYIWGRPVAHLLEALPDGSMGFDVILMSDLIFNHSEHDGLLRSCLLLNAHSPPTLLVFFTHHRPHLATKDMDFFEKTKSHWIAQEVVKKTYQPMFVDDPGDMETRSVVHGWKLLKVD
ncbi:putative methyltransferase-domain-containing protein [Thelephora terrestris]|uniref:Methyltransferase-domain-containing protein n=1 Tax=Thelephora terrestris TaxID=56493 RepID=A0A9P6L4L3_9AGAM|nr:putative methyltransferase-domain-containing protein [Thelephora terrestris]